MNSLAMRDSSFFGTLAAAGVCLGGVAAYALLRRRPSPDELERKRREQLVQQAASSMPPSSTSPTSMPKRADAQTGCS